MGRKVKNPRVCQCCGQHFDWRDDGVIWDIVTHVNDAPHRWTIELCAECARLLVNEIRGQNEELIVDELMP